MKGQTSTTSAVAVIALIVVLISVVAAFGPISTGVATGDMKRNSPNQLSAYYPYPCERCLPDSCSDTDNGQELLVRGIISGREDSKTFQFTDFCLGNSTVREYFCDYDETSSPYPDSQIMTCQSGFDCVNGECVFNPGNQSYCGDGICNGNETSSTCPGDCGGNQTLPDLIVSDIYFNNQTNTTNITITAIIYNTGSGDAGASTAQFFIPSIGSIYVYTPIVSAGQYVNIEAVYSLPSGAYNVTVTADAFNAVYESNENNNMRSEPLFI